MLNIMPFKTLLTLCALMSMTSIPAHADLTKPTTLTTTNNTSPAHSDGILAMVNDSIILKSDFERALQIERFAMQTNGQQNLSETQLQAQTLNALITKQLQLDYAKRLGMTTNADAVNAELGEIAKAQNFTSLTQLQQHIDSQSAGSYAQLRQQIAERQIIQNLQQRYLHSELSISEHDIQAFLNSPESNHLKANRLNSKEYQTLHFRIPYLSDINELSAEERLNAMRVADNLVKALQNSNASTQPQIDELLSSLPTQYPRPIEGGNMGYYPADKLPKALANRITNLQIGEVSSPLITQHGLDVIKLVNVRQSSDGQSVISPQWHAQHILVKSNENQNQQLAKQKINDIYETLRRGGDFAQLASLYSDDIGSAGKGGDLGWVNEGEMVPEFEEMMKRTPVGDFSIPFQTQFGWHIVKVADTRQKDMTQEREREQAFMTLQARQAPQIIEEWLEQLKAAAYIRVYQ